MSSVDLRQISLSFAGREVVKDVDLMVPSGSYTVLLGPSGCGKTTLLRLIAGIQAPDQGQVWIADKNVTKVPPRARNVAIVFQNDASYPHMSVRQSLEFSAKSPAIPRSFTQTSDRANDQPSQSLDRAIELTRISHLLDRYPDRLSGGELRRVAIAKAVAQNRQVLLLDEPLAALDATASAELEIDLVKLHRECGMTVIHVTHDGREAMRVADHIVVIGTGEASGQIIQEGSPNHIYAHPNSLQSASSLTAIPLNLFNAELTIANGVKTIGIRDHDVTLHGEGSDWIHQIGDIANPTLIIAVRPEDVRVVSDLGECTMATGMSLNVERCRAQNAMGQTLWTSLDNDTPRFALTAPSDNTSSELRQVRFEIELARLLFFADNNGSIGPS
ncbi:Sulfate/thiosulfate import ATP-binding protein CysA [Rubripirellula amarantea]|uniref:Sulfate/thiosulfate import ATP-binding protein CysA n=1 Tax=Rubripirellula amarantea TaxID=2527999 RepID=A0A5C5WRF8_9BACT|nr:ABC transporter ATP-binding protein [Rubripirellula amarantea]TWT52623.1 Sulfate/thiosulfate import ATP-binding protein CysA [Rubripirellula amarantea]